VGVHEVVTEQIVYAYQIHTISTNLVASVFVPLRNPSSQGELEGRIATYRGPLCGVDLVRFLELLVSGAEYHALIFRVCIPSLIR
jgi:hypothetical protein